MATKLLYDLEPATSAEIDAAMRPFIERFVVVEKRERATSLFCRYGSARARETWWTPIEYETTHAVAA